MYNLASVQENKTHEFHLGYWHTNGSPILGKTTRSYNNRQKENLQDCGLSYPGWPQIKIERKWKEGQTPCPFKGIEKNWNVKVTVILKIIGAFCPVTERLLKGLEDMEIRG